MHTVTTFSSVNLKPNPPQPNASEIMPQISEKRRLLEQLHVHKEATCEVQSFDHKTRFEMDFDQEEALDLVLEVDKTENEAEANSNNDFGSYMSIVRWISDFLLTAPFPQLLSPKSTHTAEQYKDIISCLESQGYWMPCGQTVKATTIKQWFHQLMFDKPHIF